MRVYIKRRKDEDYTYPGDMELILEYLESNGELKVSGTTVESYYYDFSDQKYSAGWMDIKDINDPILEEFANWLDNIEL